MNSSFRSHLPLLACVLVLACPRPPESTDTGGDGVCECIPVQGNDAGLDEEPMLPTCVTEKSCPLVEASSQTDWDTTTGGEGGAFVLDTPAALVCALEALRDREPVLLQWYEHIDSGWASDSGYVFIREDGLAVHRSRSWEDLGGEVSDAVLGELDSADHFQTCLDDPDDLVRFDCLRGAMASSQSVCDVGWWVSSI